MTLLLETPAITFEAGAFAARPAEARGIARDAVRLLVGSARGVEHASFSDLPAHLDPGDVLVVNTSATEAGEVDADIDGEQIVLHVANRLDDGSRVVELRTTPHAADPVLDASPGAVVTVGVAQRREHGRVISPGQIGAADGPREEQVPGEHDL